MLIGLSLIWGGSFFFVELLVDDLPAFTIVWLRVTLAAMALAAVLRAIGAAFPKGAAMWRALLVMGLLNNAVPFTLLVVAQGQITGALASILNATTPLFTLLVAHVATQDERLSTSKISGLLLGFGGVVIMMGNAALSTGAATVAAQTACLLAALSYGFAGVWGRRFGSRGMAPLATAFGMLTCSSLILLPIVLVHDQPWMIKTPGITVIGAMLALALLSTAFAYILYFRLLSRIGATNLALVTFLVPVSAIALGCLVLGETLAPRHIMGLALIMMGLIAIDGRVLGRLTRSSEH
jgi:drug/metabolite transporter (DMT)-like permease